MDKKSLFQKVSDQSTRLDIYGDIYTDDFRWYESETSAYSFLDALNKVDTDNLEVHINSYGGHVSEGLAIYNMLVEFGKNHKVTTYCDGFACSIASVIFMAGQERIMPKSSLLMIHNAWTCATGNAEDLRKAADDLDKQTQPSVEVYKENSKLTEDTIKELMRNETWISAEEAFDYGFATQIISKEANQSVDERVLYSLVSRNKALEAKLLEKENPVKNEWDKYFGK